jgi:two-component system, NarL family, response regulator
LEVLALIAEGRTNRQISEVLFITSGTVRVHVHAILQKLNVSDRTQAAIVALQRKLIH